MGNAVAKERRSGFVPPEGGKGKEPSVGEGGGGQEDAGSLPPSFVPFDNFSRQDVERLWKGFTERAPSFALDKGELACVFRAVEETIVGHGRPPEVLQSVSDKLHSYIAQGKEYVDAVAVISSIFAISSLSMPERASYLFDACDIDGDGVLVFEEVALGLKSAETGVARLLGESPAAESDVYILAKNCWDYMCPGGAETSGSPTGLDRQLFIKFLMDPLGPIYATLEKLEKMEERGRLDSTDDSLDLHEAGISRSALGSTLSIGEEDLGAMGEAGVRSGGGDEFLSVKPWKGAVVAPTRVPPADRSPPPSKLKMVHISGYCTIGCRNNLFYASRTEAEEGVVFHAASVGVIMKGGAESAKQQFFSKHTDDISCLTVCHDGNAVATGQLGKTPRIHIWDPRDAESITEIQSSHRRGIAALSFSRDGQFIASVGMDDEHSIEVHRVRPPSGSESSGAIFATKGNRGKCLELQFNPFDNSSFLVAGIKHIDFWTFGGGSASGSSKRGTFGGTAPATVICAAHTSRDSVACGMDTGSVGLFRGNALDPKSVTQAHKGGVYCILVTKVGILTGGRDGKILLYQDEFKAKVWEADLSQAAVSPYSPSIRALDATSDGRAILVGTAGSEIYDLRCSDAKSAPEMSRARPILQAHCKGELWGLAISPCRSEAMTVGDDHSLRLWSLSNWSQKALIKLGGPARACDYSCDGRLVAVGMGNDDRSGSSGGGSSTEGLVRVFSRTVDESSGAVTLTPLHELKHAKKWISQVKFSPDGRSLAVGSHDNRLYLYGVGLQPKLRARFAKHSSYITHLDWSKDGAFIQSCSGSYELLYCNGGQGKHITSATAMRDVEWDGWTCTLGWPVQGIWPACADGTDINAVSQSPSGDILATADDAGSIKLFRYPCTIDGAEFVECSGHSSHVTQCKWGSSTGQGGLLLSTGGNDRCLVFWAHS